MRMGCRAQAQTAALKSTGALKVKRAAREPPRQPSGLNQRDLAALKEDFSSGGVPLK
jgi:hypothetical protein